MSDVYGPEVAFRPGKQRRIYEVLRAFQGCAVSPRNLIWRAYGRERERLGKGRRLPLAHEVTWLSAAVFAMNERIPEPWIITRRPEGYALINEDEL